MALRKGAPSNSAQPKQGATWRTPGGKVVHRNAFSASLPPETPEAEPARAEESAQPLVPEVARHFAEEPHRADVHEQAAGHGAYGLADEPRAETAGGAGAGGASPDLFHEPAGSAAPDAGRTLTYAAGQSAADAGRTVAHGAGYGKPAAGQARTYALTRGEHAEAVVVYCSDPRFQGAFEEFVEKELGLARGTFVPIVVAGGGGVLARPHELPKEFKFIKERLELARDNFPSIRRVILIGHEDCRYYESLRSRLLGILGAKAAALVAPRGDLSAVAKLFQQLLAHLGMTVEMYYAKFADEGHTRVEFEKVGA